MNFEDARAAIYGRLAAYMDSSYPEVPVEYQNRQAIDLASQTGQWLSCEIAWSDGELVSIEAVPLGRYSGAIYLCSWLKDGQGTTAAAELTGDLALHFKAVTFDGVNTTIARPMPEVGLEGWSGSPIRVPFWFDDR